MKATRPVYLNLWRIKFPVPAIISILHRISGVVLFLGLPILLYLLSQSLISQDSFDHISSHLTRTIMRWVVWVIISALFVHFFAGIRHLLMDIGIGETLAGARKSAWLVAVLTASIIILSGIWIWS